MSAAPKFTPAPWLALPSLHGERYAVVQIGGDEMYTTGDVLAQDAPMLAAAPDLYAALRAIISPDGKSVYGTKAHIDVAVAALAKVAP